MTAGAITVENLHRTYGELEAVNGVSLSVAPGEIYGFLGPNGAGKTTLIRVLTTLLVPSSGRATVAGYDVATQKNDVRIRIGVAMQDAALDPKQNGIEFLTLQGRLYGLTSSEIAQRLTAVQGLIDIGDAIDRRISTYSGGMKRRLDVAAALMHNPEILFLDEPTTGLDPVSRSKVWAEVRRLNSELGMTIFLTTQYLEEADVLADRVGIIDKGRLVAEGTPAELKRSVGSDVIEAHVGDCATGKAALEALPGVQSVEVKDGFMLIAVTDGASLIGRVVVTLENSGCGVKSITLRTATLDDVFFEVTGAHIEPTAEEVPA